MKTAELRQLNKKELLDRCEELRGTVFKLRSLASSESKDKTACAVAEHKKEIARILTLVKEKELEANVHE